MYPYKESIMTKLTRHDIAAIKQACKMKRSHRSIARAFKISIGHVITLNAARGD